MANGKAGAPIGNTNGAKARPWAAAIERAINKRSLIEQRDALDDLAEQLLAKCDERDVSALKELGDRLDGKAKQMLSGDPDNPIMFQRIEQVIVDPDAQD